MTKIFKCLSVVFIVLMIMSVAVTSVAAADNPQRNNAIDASKYRMAMDNGLIFTSDYLQVNPLGRWNTNPRDDNDNVMGNHQGQFFAQTYVPALNYWNNNIDKVINNINSLTDDTLFTTYKKELDKVLQDYIAALAAGEGCLYSMVTKDTILQNNNDLEVCVTNIDTAKENFISLSNEVENAKRQSNLNESVNSATDELFNIPQALWTLLGNTVSDVASDTSVFGLSLGTIETVAYNLSPYIHVIAYLVMIVSFATSAGESAMRFELTTPRGAMKIFIQLALGKAVIDISIRLCIAVIKIINGIAANAISVTSGLGSFNGTDLTDALTGTGQYVLSVTSGNPVAIFSFLFSIIPKIVICVVIIVTICKVMIKLIMRNFELGCLLTVAPIGFATLAGETTKRFFTKYIGALLGSAFTILFIAITYNLVSVWMHNLTVSDTSVLVLSSEWIVMILLCAMSKFVWKPPASLSNLFTIM